jgi:hypothetical protein
MKGAKITILRQSGMGLVMGIWTLLASLVILVFSLRAVFVHDSSIGYVVLALVFVTASLAYLFLHPIRLRILQDAIEIRYRGTTHRLSKEDVSNVVVAPASFPVGHNPFRAGMRSAAADLEFGYFGRVAIVLRTKQGRSVSINLTNGQSRAALGALRHLDYPAPTSSEGRAP